MFEQDHQINIYRPGPYTQIDTAYLLAKNELTIASLYTDAHELYALHNALFDALDDIDYDESDVDSKHVKEMMDTERKLKMHIKELVDCVDNINILTKQLYDSSSKGPDVMRCIRPMSAPCYCTNYKDSCVEKYLRE